MDVLIKVVLPLGLAFIMFSLGLGLTIQDFKRVLTRPFAFMVGAINQVVLLPVIAFLIVLIFGIKGELAVGMMILSFCPGGVTSNIISRFARGDVALSVSLTAVISLLSLITVPVLLVWAVSYFVGGETQSVNITGIAVTMFLLTTLPVSIGLAVRHYATGKAERIEPLVARIAGVLFAIIILGALAANWSLFVENLPTLAPALITLNIALLVVGFITAKMVGLTMSEVKTVAIETGVQNGTLGITVATLIVGQAAGFSAYSLPSAVYGITMYLVALPFVALFRRK